MPSFDLIAIDSLAAVTGGCHGGGMANRYNGGYAYNGGFRYTYRIGMQQQQQQQQVQQAAAAPAPRERGPRDVLVQTASGVGAQAPAGMMQDMGLS
jgi:hypothetical protein